MVPQVDMTFPTGPWLTELLRLALQEDIGAGDATTAVAVDPRAQAVGLLVPREAGVVAGLPLVEHLFALLDARVLVRRLADDGSRVKAGRPVARLEGPAAALLTGERTLLNFLQHLGGIATLTARYVDAVSDTRCQVLDTRKTLPGYRLLDKYAVRCGGGGNHRLGLYDRILLKDNHWAARADGIAHLVERARSLYPELVVEVEVDGLAQLAAVLPLPVDWILLDNFSLQETQAAVRMRGQAGASARLESSGNIGLETVAAYAHAGVDAVSVGRLTHSAPAWDLGLDLTRPDGATPLAGPPKDVQP